MPPAWPFTALSAAWRRRCAAADSAGLAAAATDAFVDRAPIDWHALGTRARDEEERSLLDALRVLDRLRQAAAPASRRPELPPRRWLLRALIALAALQTATALLTVLPSVLERGLSLRSSAQFGLALSFAGAALLLAAPAPLRDARRIFLLGMLVCSASAFARGALSALPHGENAWSRGLWLEVFAPACMWQFAVDFPRVRRFARFDVTARHAATLLWGLGATAFAINLAVVLDFVSEASAGAFLPNRRSNVFWRAYTIAMVLAVASIFVRSRRAPPDEQRRVARFAAGLAAGAAPFLTLGLARTVVPPIDRWLLTTTAGRVWIDAVVVSALMATPILMSAAVAIDRPFGPQRSMADAWRRLARRAAIWSDRRQRRQLTRALRRLRGARGARDVARIAAEAVAAGLAAPFVRVLVPDSGRFADCLGSTVSVPDGAAVVSMLRESTRPLDLSPGGSIHELLPEPERTRLASSSIQIAVPITTRKAELAAIIVAGQTQAFALDRKDLWFAEAIAAAASAAWTTESADAAGGKPLAPDDRELALECPGCGLVQSAVPLRCGCGSAPEIASLPTTVGSAFTVHRRLGSGGMGVVYLGIDSRLNRLVALKTLPAVAPGAVVRLQREARAMAALNHDALATIYGLEIWRDVPVLVCEYFPAGTLADRLARDGPLPPGASLAVALDVARALDYMHANGVVHGDVKPRNIAFAPGGAVKLLDFGLSRLARDPSDPRPLPIAGTLAYLPPETLRGEAAAFSADLWSIAVVLLECLLGRNPYACESAADTRRTILESTAIDICAGVRDIDRRIASFLTRALGPAERRWQTARQLRSALERLRSELRP